MAKTNWKSNDFEGRALRRAIKRTLKLAEHYAADPQTFNAYVRTFAYLVQTKGQLVKFEVEREIEARLQRLESLANVASHGTISK